MLVVKVLRVGISFTLSLFVKKKKERKNLTKNNTNSSLIKISLIRLLISIIEINYIFVNVKLKD